MTQPKTCFSYTEDKMNPGSGAGHCLQVTELKKGEQFPTCRDCVDVCPIKGTLYFSNGKVQVNEATCTYCGACKVVCPVDEALTLKRTKVLHTPIHSGTWNKALERVTSPIDVVKELKAKGGMNAKNAVAKLLPSKETIR